MVRKQTSLYVSKEQRDILAELALSIGCTNPKSKRLNLEASISEMVRMLATAMQKHPSDTAATMRIIRQIAQGD
jgi:hypothetical protein